MEQEPNKKHTHTHSEFYKIHPYFCTNATRVYALYIQLSSTTANYCIPKIRPQRIYTLFTSWSLDWFFSYFNLYKLFIWTFGIYMYVYKYRFIRSFFFFLFSFMQKKGLVVVVKEVLSSDLIFGRYFFIFHFFLFLRWKIDMILKEGNEQHTHTHTKTNE